MWFRGSVFVVSLLVLTPSCSQLTPRCSQGNALPAPSGPDWCLVGYGGESIAYAKNAPNDKRHSIEVHAELLHLPVIQYGVGSRRIYNSTELLEFVRESSVLNEVLHVQRERLSDVEFANSPETLFDRNCIRLEFSAKDKGVPYAVGLEYSLTGSSRLCLHLASVPTTPLVTVLTESQRFPRGGAPLPLEQEVKAFFAAYLNGSEKPLLKAVQRADVDGVRQLLASGADPNDRDDALAHSHMTPLMEATLVGSLDILSLLLDAGADPNAVNDSGNTALMFAAGKNQAKMISMLLDRGAEPNRMASAFGTTAVASAARNGAIDALRILIERGANPDLPRSERGTPLTTAAWAGQEAAAILLVEYGADVNATTGEGITPLMYAAGNGMTALARLLMVKGANVNATTNHGLTALSAAEHYKRHDMITLLKSVRTK